jgi:hypothetical protein
MMHTASHSYGDFSTPPLWVFAPFASPSLLRRLPLRSMDTSSPEFTGLRVTVSLPCLS